MNDMVQALRIGSSRPHIFPKINPAQLLSFVVKKTLTLGHPQAASHPQLLAYHQ